jgi:hypothetical protein
MRLPVYLLFGALAAAAVACSEVEPKRSLVGRPISGDDWPLTISVGEVQCDRDAVIFIGEDSATYAVNGTALGRADKEGWRDIEEIWADDPENPGLKIYLGPVIDAGLELC